MTSAPVPPEIVEKLTKACREPGIEKPCLVCKASEEIDEKKWKDRYLLLTECCLYVFANKDVEKTKKSKKLMPETLSLFELDKVEVDTDRNNEIYIRFKNIREKERLLKFRLSQASSLCQNLEECYKTLMWNVNAVQLGFSSELLKAIVSKPHRAVVRPKSILQLRYISWCAAREMQCETDVMDILNKYSEAKKDDKKVILLEHIPNTTVKTCAQVMFCLSLEPGLRNMVLDNFSPQDLGNILDTVIALPGPWDSLDLKHYGTDAVLKPIRLRRSPFNHLTVVRIHDCPPAFLSEFLKNVKSAAYSLRTLVLDGIKFDKATEQDFRSSLDSCQFVSNLDTLAFVNCSAAGKAFKEFAIECLQAMDGLTSFCIERCGVDICETLVDIARVNSTSLQRIYLRGNTCNTVVTHDDSILQSGVLSLDVGECTWTVKSFAAFLSELCKRPRRLPLALSVDGAKLDGSWENVFRSVSVDSLSPVVTELNFANNELDSKSMEVFLRFLDSQVPKFSLTPTRLQHLNVSHCLKTESLVNSLCSFFSVRELWGLEICGARPTPNFASIPNLYSLNIGENEFDQKCVSILLKFLRESSSIAEVGVEQIKFDDIPLMMSFYKDLVEISGILAFKCPTELFNSHSKYSETKIIRGNMRSKRRYSTTQDRLQLFLSLAGDFSTRVAKTIEISESTDKDHVSSPLFEKNFHNPIPSLFTLAALATGDTSFDPVASMVTEFVATSGRYGIVPPTAAPPTAPEGPMRLPAIFSTLESRDEIEQSYEIPFDPGSSEISKLSAEVAETMQKAQGKLSPAGNWKAWQETKKFSTFAPLDVRD